MAAKACPLALSSRCGQRALRGPSRTKTQQRGPKRFNFLRDRSPGVGARGRSPRESADPQVRRAGSWSKQGGRKLRKQYRGGGGLGRQCGRGPWPCTTEMHGILHVADVSGQGCGTGDPRPLLGAPRAPPAAFSESETGYRADHSTVFGASHDTFRRHRFLGVGGSGCSPLECTFFDIISAFCACEKESLRK